MIYSVVLVVFSVIWSALSDEIPTIKPNITENEASVLVAVAWYISILPAVAIILTATCGLILLAVVIGCCFMSLKWCYENKRMKETAILEEKVTDTVYFPGVTLTGRAPLSDTSVEMEQNETNVDDDNYQHDCESAIH